LKKAERHSGSSRSAKRCSLPLPPIMTGAPLCVRIGRQGEIRDRTSEGEHYRIAGLNLLAAIIIYWNTDQLGKAVAQRKRAGQNCSPELLAHIGPIGRFVRRVTADVNRARTNEVTA
jgi:hypothetical protein